MFTFYLEKFTPAEAASVSGTSCGLQRSYRQKGYLSEQHGHAPFSIFGLAELAFVKAMTETSCPPDFLKRLRNWAVSGIVYQALRDEDAFASPDIGLDVDLVLCAPNVLARYSALEVDCRRVIPERFLIIWADKSCKWVASLNEMTAVTPVKAAGPVIVLDQKAVGDALRQRARRPLVRVSRVAAVPNTANDFAKETVG